MVIIQSIEGLTLSRWGHKRGFISALSLGLMTTLALAAISTPHQAFAQAPSAARSEYVPGEIIVKLKGKSKTLHSQAFVGKAVTEKSMSLKGSWNGINMHHFALKSGENVEAAIAELMKDPDVEYAEPNYIVRRQSAGFESEPVSMGKVREESVSAMAAGRVGAFAQTSAPIQLANAWALETASLAPPVVAVIDTGIDLNHEVFVNSGALYNNEDEIPGNGIDDDQNGYVDDVHGWNFAAGSNSPQDDDGHGTHVSGIILGTTQDITASPLTSAVIRIMPLKFLDASGSGTTSDAIKAIYYAVNNGAKVLNNSWGGGGFSRSLLDAIAFSYDHKVLFVAAAGNAASNNDSSPTYPSNYDVPNLISVAATSDIDGFATFSNYGSQTVHMGSPGVSIWSTFPGGMYGRSSGTSMAAPFVSGLAALMSREAPTMTGYQMKELIFSASEQVSSLQTRTVTKARLNVYNGVTLAKSAAIETAQPAYEATGADRAPDALQAEAPVGCGLVAKALYDASGGGGPSGPFKSLAFFAVMIVLLAPIVASVLLRNKATGRDQRRHDRFQISSAVTMKVGDRELVGQLSSISLGGAQVNTEALLENGGIVKMSIRSPDGKDEVEVEGRIVWSEENKHYGVAFSNAEDSVRSTISRWTAGLIKT